MSGSAMNMNLSYMKKTERSVNLKSNSLKHMRRSSITETVGSLYMKMYKKKPERPLKRKAKKLKGFKSVQLRLKSSVTTP